MVSEISTSPYLMLPLRTLRQVCIDIAFRRGLERPDCDDCELEPVCIDQARRQRREQKKRERHRHLGNHRPQPVHR